jgi:hypothetical protein
MVARRTSQHFAAAADLLCCLVRTRIIILLLGKATINIESEPIIVQCQQ